MAMVICRRDHGADSPAIAVPTTEVGLGALEATSGDLVRHECGDGSILKRALPSQDKVASLIATRFSGDLDYWDGADPKNSARGSRGSITCGSGCGGSSALDCDVRYESPNSSKSIAARCWADFESTLQAA